MGIRTDLALEARELYNQTAKETSEINGVEADVKKDSGITITKITITNENGEKALGKPKGTYVTIEAPDIKYSTEMYEKTCYLLADEIRNMVNINKDTKTLVVGLGNKSITPDALGPDVVSKLMVTNHMKGKIEGLFDEDLTSVCAIAPGVLGTTGMETAEIIKGVIGQVHPDLCICVDALASRSLDRISTTFQFQELSKKVTALFFVPAAANVPFRWNCRRRRTDKPPYLSVVIRSMRRPQKTASHSRHFSSA